MLALRILSFPLVAAVVLAGLWLSGGVITNDFALAMWLTVAWMGVAGLAALALAARSRAFRWPVLGGYGAVAVAAAVYLGSSQLFDSEVDEAVATAPAPLADGAVRAEAAPARNRLVAAGAFEPVRHAARGRAEVIDLADGGRVLTLTRFEVDNGPDLRVYLVRGPARSEDEVSDRVDLGALKGNRGDQQYELPRGTDVENATVVVWCRAFSVLFARAPLER